MRNSYSCKLEKMYCEAQNVPCFAECPKGPEKSMQSAVVG